uniref:Uncharacterized protein n=1 Tax=Sphaerodactylus townsendi TaxID=933632 RepID=A0ACB8F1Y9_9SAUR
MSRNLLAVLRDRYSDHYSDRYTDRYSDRYIDRYYDPYYDRYNDRYNSGNGPSNYGSLRGPWSGGRAPGKGSALPSTVGWVLGADWPTRGIWRRKLPGGRLIARRPARSQGGRLRELRRAPAEFVVRLKWGTENQVCLSELLAARVRYTGLQGVRVWPKQPGWHPGNGAETEDTGGSQDTEVDQAGSTGGAGDEHVPGSPFPPRDVHFKRTWGQLGHSGGMWWAQMKLFWDETRAIGSPPLV